MSSLRPAEASRFWRQVARGGRPRLLRGGCADWPARRRWSLEALSQSVQGRAAKRYLANPETTVTIEMLTFGGAGIAGGGVYQIPLSQADVLREALLRPAAWGALDDTEDSLWLTGRGQCTPMHFDFPHSLVALFQGEKCFTVYSPWASGSLYGHSWRGPTPTFSPVDPGALSLRHPRAAGLPAFVCTLRAGDLLYLPAGWWHHVEALSDCVGYNSFWSRGLSRLVRRAALAYRERYRTL